MKKIGNLQSTQSKTIYYILIFSVLFILPISEVFSNDVKVAAVVTPRQIQLNERAKLELSISGNTLIEDIGTPKFNFLPDFLVVPLQTKTTPHLVENNVAVEMAWAYELIPQKIGEVVLSDISFSYQGVPYVANPGKIIVGAADTYTHPSTGGIHKVEATISKKNPYVHEAIEYRFRYLYTAVLPTKESAVTTLPKFQDFIIEEQSDEKAGTVKLRGNIYHYQESLIRIYPKNTGKILIQSTQLELPIKSNPKILKTESIPINVQPLPELGIPPDFNGAVGEYNITAQVDRTRLEVREALTLTLIITGSGNFNTVNPPRLTSLNGFRVDPPNHVNNNTTNNAQYTYVVIPLKAGILKIPTINFSYFNPKKHNYQTTNTTPIPITVLPNPTGVEKNNTDTYSWLLWLILIPLLTVVGYGGYLIYRSKLNTNNGNPSTDGTVIPSGQVNEVLEELDSLKENIGSTSLVEEVPRLFNKFLCDIQGVPQRKLNITEIPDICQQYNIPKPIVDEIVDILKKGEHHRFAPVPLSVEERNTLVTRITSVIKHVDETESIRTNDP